MTDETTFRALAVEVEDFRDQAKGLLLASNEAIANTTWGEHWMGIATICLGGFTTFTAAVPAFAEYTLISIASAAATTIAASSRDKSVPDLVRAGLDYGKAFAGLAKILSDWSIARAKGRWDEPRAAADIALFRDQMIEFGTKHSRLRLKAGLQSSGPRSGTGFET